MDPMSALSVAAAVIQFVDFGRHLLSASCEIYRSPSGETAKEVDLSTIAKDLAGFIALIKDKIATSTDESRQNTDAEYQMVKICEECEEIVTDFHEALDQAGRNLKENRKSRLVMARGAIRKALAMVWNSSKIDGMIEQLEKLKGRLMNATLFCLWDESKRSEHRDIQFRERLDDMIAMLKRLDDRVNLMEEESTHELQHVSRLDSSLNVGRKSATEKVIDALNDGRSPEAVRIHEELVESLWNRHQLPEQRDWIAEESEGRNKISAIVQNSFRKTIVESLVFETIQGREEAIPKAFEKTFSWIFQREPTELAGKRVWSSFPEWLESDTHQPYWITGKPGSGKSTLMKFILQHGSLKPHLQTWADNFVLLITSYYAWVAGSDLQKSCEGLMRTLLYQALQLNPSLVPEVAPRRWSLFVTLRSIAKMPRWQSWEIEESFEFLLAKCGRTMRLALFIDGLDEFQSPPFQVLDLIQRINARDGIKVCVASRQWNEFNDAFHESPMLRMQDLTTADMAYFVAVKFEGNRGFLELKKIFPTQASHLIDDVVKRASGVFLWISLVVRSLLEALTEGDGLAELQATVDQLPSDLAQLYDAIWSRISNRNISASSKLLVTYKAATGPVSYLTLWLADERQSLNFDINSLFADARSGITDIMKRRLDSRTRGILEISNDGTVNFLHRTARDWTLKPSVWDRIRSEIPDGFDPYLLLLKAETILIPDKSNPRCENIEELWLAFNKSLWYASQVEESSANTSELVRVLDKFNKEADKVAEPHLHLKLADHHLLVHGWHSQQRGAEFRLHWASTQSSNLGGRANTFLGLMAQFCVLPYLRTKFIRGSEPINPKLIRNLVSPLENAVFGYDGVTDPRTSISFPISYSQRLETVAFLLDRGASPKQAMFSGNAVIDEVRAARVQERESVSSEYWAEVEELMDTKLGSKRTLRSIFTRRKSP